MRNLDLWHRWFAWYPIAYGPFISWLRFIQRRKDHKGNWLYRRDIYPL